MHKQLIKEWEQEPNFLEFIDEETNYQCFIVRNQHVGNLLGYVQIPKNNKLYKNNLEAIERLEIEVHGGITFANDLFRVINAPFDFDIDDAYGIGFDCAHTKDLLPFFNTSGEYRNIEYVTNECKKLAKQLKAYECVKKI
jgi:hypothetical protein